MSQEVLSHQQHYNYVGPYAKDPSRVEQVANFLKTTAPVIEASEANSPEYDNQFFAMGEAIWELGRDLGLDLSDRVKSENYLHLYSETEYDKVRKQIDHSMGSVAVHTMAGHILASEGKTSIETLANVNHELVHVMAYNSVHLGPADGDQVAISPAHEGYASARHDTFLGANEIITEITNIDLMRNYWPRQEELADFGQEKYENIGYLPEIIFFDELLKSRFENPRAIFKHLQAGMFEGKMSALRSLTEVVGADVMRKIAALNDVDSTEKVVALAQELGLDEAVRKIRDNDKRDLLAWL